MVLRGISENEVKKAEIWRSRGVKERKAKRMKEGVSLKRKKILEGRGNGGKGDEQMESKVEKGIE